MLTIAWDIDDVLNQLMRDWFSQDWLPLNPDCKLSYLDLKQNPPDAVLGIIRAEYLSSLDSFRISKRAHDLRPNLEIVKWLDSFGADYRHIALTVRPLESTPHAAEWVFRHFGKYIRSFAVVPSRPESNIPIYDRDKGEFLRWFGKADVLVDDNEENVCAAESLGIRGVLFPQPWNRAVGSVQQTLDSINSRAHSEHPNDSDQQYRSKWDSKFQTRGSH